MLVHKKVWKFIPKIISGVVSRWQDYCDYFFATSLWVLYTKIKNLKMEIGKVILASVWEYRGTRRCQEAFGEEKSRKNTSEIQKARNILKLKYLRILSGR